MKRNNTLITLVCATALYGGAAMAGGDKLKFSVDDQDGNGQVSQAELVSSIEETALFSHLDENDNAVLEEDETRIVDYDEITDLDKGGYIDRSEFALAVFEKYDGDENNRLDQDEYEELSEDVADALES